jgi:hypothetical protein
MKARVIVIGLDGEILPKVSIPSKEVNKFSI